MFSSRRTDGGERASQRSLAMSRQAMVCTSQSLASSAALDQLRQGGNAIDAAIAAAAVLGVVEPYNTGIGGDCFMLIWIERDRRLHGLNGSGRAPRAATLEAFRARGLTEVPPYGMLPVTVPGTVDAWCEALSRFGRKSLADALGPAIAYAEEGYPLSEVVARDWGLIVRAGLLRHPDALRTFTVEGEAPRLGQIVRLPGLARSLRAIAAGGRDVFYAGELAERIVAFSRANGGLLEPADLAEHGSTWVEPISTDYRSYRLYELPPNTQGLTALIALNVLECFDLGAIDPVERLHLRIEAVKLAFADRNRWIADPEHAAIPTAELASKEYARRRAALVDRRRALDLAQLTAPGGGADTVYLTVADGEGNVVSLINSLYQGFGSGMVVGDTGIALQNRGRGFVLDPAHPNCIAPGKRPFHTIIPAMLFRADRPLVSFGVMGGDVQAQAHVQVVSRMVDEGLNVQEALDQPRFHFLDGSRVALEAGGDTSALAAGLADRGHTVEHETATLLRGGFGGGQGIMVDPVTRAYWGGSDRRKDGVAIGF
jgi:gamma-glutamyltranspeptidase/glutathione hydrolase